MDRLLRLIKFSYKGFLSLDYYNCFFYSEFPTGLSTPRVVFLLKSSSKVFTWSSNLYVDFIAFRF